jgi:hypothetical protein
MKSDIKYSLSKKVLPRKEKQRSEKHLSPCLVRDDIVDSENEKAKAD